MTLRFRSLSVRGFRAYGSVEQTLNLPEDLAAVWGPNSKGKTSLAEAFEFLLTGSITRRELMSSSQDEFADALRNAHLPADNTVRVTASLEDANGELFVVARTLKTDYGKRQECESVLTINDVPSDEEALKTLGLKLSSPPLSAPVLAQHTLSHIFSVRPADRSSYFKAILEVGDLDELRSEIAMQCEDNLEPPLNIIWTQFEVCTDNPVISKRLAPMQKKTPNLNCLKAVLSETAEELLIEAESNDADDLDGRLQNMKTILAEKRSGSFQLTGFRHSPLSNWAIPNETVWNELEVFLKEHDRVDQHTRELSALFEEALKIPAIADVEQDVDCHLCGTESALTLDRVDLIRGHVKGTANYSRSEKAAIAALAQLTASAKNLSTSTLSSMPEFAKVKPEQRRRIGFTTKRMRELLDDDADEILNPWTRAYARMLRSLKNLEAVIYAVEALIDEFEANLGNLDPVELRRLFDDLFRNFQMFGIAHEAYSATSSPLIESITNILDNLADTDGWQEFIEIASSPDALRAALIERLAYANVEKEYKTAMKSIDKAKDEVLNLRFGSYSDLVQEWWQRLRPDEPTFFSAVQPRKGSKRTIDFKAGLSISDDQSSPKIRDVIAVFSQSQLHCLGLAVFLARAEREAPGFIILDDPVLSSDEDHRVHFGTTVVPALLDLPMQVIVLTQENKTWKELEVRYRHRGLSTAQIYVENPSDGSIIENTSDELLAKISRAKSLSRNGHPDVIKTCGLLLRDAGERFCKEVLIADEKRQGNENASLTDYDGKVLEWLCPRVEPLLNKDPSHPGKFEAYRNTTNNACHDNAPPSTGEMKMACGEIEYLQKQYLPRA